MADDDTEVLILNDFSDISDSAVTLFQIGDYVVQFAPHREDGDLRGWVVTSTTPGYQGFLHHSTRTQWGANGAEAVRDYVFEFRRPEDVTVGGPLFLTGAPTGVTVEEFKAFYFGDHPATD